jgi:hypothetical protein
MVMVTVTPAPPSTSAASSRVRASVIRCRKSFTNAVGSKRSAQRGVVDLAFGLEVARQVVVRIAPPVAAVDVDFPAPYRISQCDQRAQFIGDALG